MLQSVARPALREIRSCTSEQLTVPLDVLLGVVPLLAASCAMPAGSRGLDAGAHCAAGGSEVRFSFLLGLATQLLAKLSGPRR